MKLRKLARALYLFLNGAHKSWRSYFIKSLKLSKGDVFVDIGGGSGVWTGELSQFVGMAILADREVSGYERNFERAKSIYLSGRDNCFIVKCDARLLPFKKGVLNKILCSEVLEHIPDPLEAVNEIGRVLKTGGRVVFTTPCASFINSYDFAISKFGRKIIPKRLQRSAFLKYSYEEFEKMAGHVRRGFEMEDIKEFERGSELKLIITKYSHKGLAARYYELQEGFFLLSLLVLPFTRLLYYLLDFNKDKGLNLLCTFEKGRS